MRTLTLLTLLALSAVAPLAAMEAETHHAATVLNTECPMCHKAVGDKPSTVKITVGEGTEAKSFLLACESMDCCKAFLKDPEPVLKKTFGKSAPGPKTQFK